VWSANGDYPGTAFTRSLGDRIAEECGVNAEPEILERCELDKRHVSISRLPCYSTRDVCCRELEPQDKYLIIASDGVFEFLTNQMVADECAHHTDPLMACKAVVAQAYHLWLQYEVRTDDITMVAVYLDEFSSTEAATQLSGEKSDGAASDLGGKAGTAGRGPPLHKQASLDITEQRPVRRVMSKEKRKHMIEVQTDLVVGDEGEEISEEEMKALMVPKTPAEAELISAAIKSNFLFQHLNAQQREAVVGLMRPVNVKAGDRIIRQGDRGDRFYLIDHGRFEVRVRATLPPPAPTPTNGAASLTSPPIPPSLRVPTPTIDESLPRNPSGTNLADIGRVTPTTGITAERNKSNSLIQAIREKSSSLITVERAPTAVKIAYEPNAELMGNVVHVYESSAHSHPGFGELSLM
jgi:uncharacterized tellurite resistance protein B-like protein